MFLKSTIRKTWKNIESLYIMITMHSTLGIISDFFKKISKRLPTRGRRDWDGAYKTGQAPWDTGEVSDELKKVLKEHKLKPQNAIELGCGTGTNSIFLSALGVEVVGVDGSEEALRMARQKLSEYFEKKKVIPPVRFEQAQLPNLQMDFTFDFIFDRGCFHTFVKNTRTQYAQMAAQLLHSGGHYLLLTGNAKKPASPGPPVLTEEEIRETFEKDFDFIHIRDFYWSLSAGSENSRKGGALGYSCLMVRK